MNERDFEIIFAHHLEHYLGVGWRLVGQQMSLNIGRIDMLVADPSGGRHIIELKKGSPQVACIEQVLAYRQTFLAESSVDAVCWIVANEISSRLHVAAQAAGVRTLAIAESDLFSRSAVCKLNGPRKTGDGIFGGETKHGLRNVIDEAIAYEQLPTIEFKKSYNTLKAIPKLHMASGLMQTVIKYRGIKIGGINRTTKGGHFYISNGLVLTAETQAILLRYGGRRDEGKQAHKTHKHVFYEFTKHQSTGFMLAVQHCIDIINQALGPCYE